MTRYTGGMTATMANRADMITDALRVHETDHCGSAPCADAVKLAVLLSTQGINSIPAGHELTQPRHGGGSGHGYGKAKRSTEATEPMKGYLRKLIAERDFLSLEWGARELVTKFQQTGSIAFADARDLIDTLKATAYSAAVSSNGFQKDRTARVQEADKARRAEIAEPLEAGMYRRDDVIYKVQVAVHGSGQPYAKKLVVEQIVQVEGDEPANWVHFEYAPGAIRKLTPEHRLSLDEAKAFGALYGSCCVCGRTLTQESSIEAGIGPICQSRV